MSRLLIVHAGSEGQTERIAGRIGALAGARGHEVRVTDLDGIKAHGLSPDTGGVVVGASVHVGRHPRALEDWVKARRDWLAQRPSAFFSVSLSAAAPGPKGRADAQRLLDEFLARTDWQPDRTAIFAGALRYSRYGLLKRVVMKNIARSVGSYDLDTHRDYEYTDWAEVERFTTDFLSLCEPSEV